MKVPEQIENKMVLNHLWESLEKSVPDEITEKPNGAGYEEIGTGIFVPEEDAYEYALERISQDEELKQELVEWFYSGNWVKEE